MQRNRPEYKKMNPSSRSYWMLAVTFVVSLVLSTPIGAQFSLVYVGPIPNQDFQVGRVMARSIVLDPDTGQPILVEFDTEGKEVEVIGLSGNSVEDLSVVPAADYRFFKLQLDEFKERHRDDLAKGAELITSRQYEQRTFVLADNQTTVNKPPLKEGINSVFVRGQFNRIVNDPDQLILLKFNLDMTQDINIPDSNISLVVNNEGQIIAKSDNNIGYRTGFFGDPNEPQNSRGFRVSSDDEIFGPIKGVKVFVDEFVYRGGVDITDEDGKFGLHYFMPLCPVGGFTFNTDVWAELRYKNFLPTGSPSIPYYLRKPGYSYCFAAIVPEFLAPTILAISSFFAQPFIQNNLFADVMFVTGKIVIKNIQDENIDLGETGYTSFEQEAEKVTQKFYDFDNNGVNDAVSQGRLYECINAEINQKINVFQADNDGVAFPDGYQCEEINPDPDGGQGGNLQAIFFDGSQADAFDFPDLIRIIDRELRNEPIGVLKSIGSSDLRNTDVLFFRESTGQLIMERRGLKEAEARYRRAIEYDEEENVVAYRVMLRGRDDSRFNIGGGVRRNQSYEDWATEYQLEEPFRARESDQPRPGEYIKIVAINRATGYTGTARVQLKSPGDTGTTLLDVAAPEIVMRPPNLKIWAERTYEVEKGLTAGEDRTYTIGSEGAALTSDKTITIFTQWLDAQGKPLPDELGLDNGEQYGLTGRLAKVVGANQLEGASAGSDLAEFPIAPGRNTQVIRVKDNLSTAEHFYIHVIGKPKNQECVSDASCPSFNVNGSQAPYDSRPQLLTPFLVPLADEDRHWQEYSQYRTILRNQNDNTPQSERPIKPLPAYVWQRRPEYQFSQFDLEINELNLTTTGANGEPEVVNILDDPTPTIPGGDEMLSVLYSLISSEQSRLTPIDGERQLVLAVGETEMILTIRADGSITFNDLGSLAGLEPEDFLSIRIYANNDSANILWEFAFGSVRLGTDLNRDGMVDVVTNTQLAEGALSDVTSVTKPFRFWLNNDFDVVNDSGEIDLERAECPIFTGNQVCEQWDEPTDKGTNTDPDKLNYIESNRDLEDFAPLAIRLIAEHGPDGNIKLEDGMTAEIKAVGLSINLFQGEWDEGTDYLTDLTKLKKQMENQAKEKYLFELKANAGARQLTQNDLNKLFGRKDVAKLIFEGTGKSSLDCAEDATNCYIEFTIKRGNTVISTDKLYMTMLPVKHYYDHFTVGKELLTGLQAVATNAHPEFQFKPLLIAEDPDVEKRKDDYIMMVHGWRMQYEERVQFAEIAFKRLYWSGYKGRYGFYSWPTGWFKKPAHEYSTFDVGRRLVGNEQNYGDSEALARKAGERLREKLLGLSTTYNNIHIFAHSMGNVVVSEALRNAKGTPLVKHYIASQAATVASAYNNLVEHIEHEYQVAPNFFCLDTNNKADPEKAWRCYNQNGLDTEYDMPPNLYSYTIPALHGATKPTLEIMVAQRDGWGPHYYRDVEQSAEQIINFYNINDIALTGWEFNQLTKPDSRGALGTLPEWDYEFDWDCPYSTIVCAIDFYPDDEDGEVVTDIYTVDRPFSFEKEYVWTGDAPIDLESALILGHIIPARSNALGQKLVPISGTSEVSDNVEISEFGKDNQGHSAQFYNTYSSRQDYWMNVLIEFKLIDE